MARRATWLAAGCLALWLAELVPVFVPALLLIAAIPLVIGVSSPGFGLGSVLGWAADPVLALFFGGFTLGAAAAAHGLDARVAAAAVRLARGRRDRLALTVLGATAGLSMWMSNIAAAAMMLAAIRPLLARHPGDARFRTGLLLALAAGANFGGMATPVGSGPNAIAIAALENTRPVSFIEWMALGLPLTLGLGFAAFLALRWRYGLRGSLPTPDASAADLAGPAPASHAGARIVVAIFAATVVMWLTEPLHGVSAPIVALASAAFLFATGTLGARDLARIDWSTLLLIAGGLVLGRLLERSGAVTELGGRVPWADLPPAVRSFALVFASAALSAVASNTATAAMLVSLAAVVDPSPGVAILIAMGASLGVPFAISTPPNAMIYAEGVSSRTMMELGLPLMIGGSVLVALTGPVVLRLLGIP